MKSGILLLDKPQGITSFDCIRKLKKAWDRSDLGHAGTLDKFAGGLLPILAGEGLKLARFFLESYPTLPTYWKTYRGTFELGRATVTGDPEGEVSATAEVGVLSIDQIAQAMQSFVNQPYAQTPPAYSAKKIAGERSSDLARDGKEVVLKPVDVTIRRFEVLSFREGRFVDFEVECSKGTYVRSLALDLAAKLGTVAYVSALTRNAVGNFSIAQAISLEAACENADATLCDLARASSFLSPFELIGNEQQLLKTGQVSNLLTRLANSGLDANVYCATAFVGNSQQPLALLELGADRTTRFLRTFV